MNSHPNKFILVKILHKNGKYNLKFVNNSHDLIEKLNSIKRYNYRKSLI